MTATFPAVLTDTGTFTEHDGILISYVGEDADLIALGHHDLAHALTVFKTVYFDTVEADDIDITWAVLTDPPAHNCVATPTTSCSGCEAAEGVPWWMRWGVDLETAGAFPVMVVEA